ncbi:hypothetical protein B0A52_03939 [Exophiala mesophila]|uniref:CAP-Gly domain-containing protein n=1 Tax=Exophiala mesophila TaxID=212818 RepID=A0A438N856_EXOME|nr:hypothetical protein B0A52_03939 [Exophiala mesophila]
MSNDNIPSTSHVPKHYINQRLSFNDAPCTVRWIGTLPKTTGTWLGVEWDDVSRGKHDGTYDGRRIFRCITPDDTTAASFVRPSRKPDEVRTLMEAIKRKYSSGIGQDKEKRAPGATADVGGEQGRHEIVVSGKVVEEVGFDKISAQLSDLAELRIVLVDELRVGGVTRTHEGWTEEGMEEAQEELRRACPKIVELDVGWNLMESWEEVLKMCVPFERLKILKASGLRLWDLESHKDGRTRLFESVQELHLNECLLRSDQISSLLSYNGDKGPVFPALKTLSLNSNALPAFSTTAAVSFPSVTTLTLDNNRLTDLSSLPDIFKLFPNLSTLSLQGNSISDINLPSRAPPTFPSLTTLNIAANKIASYHFLDSLPSIFPKLTSLRITRNPLYDFEGSVTSTETSSGINPQHGPLSAGAQADSRSYYLTLARIPSLHSLNYTTITPRDREEGEIYYLSVVDKEIHELIDPVVHASTSPPHEVIRQELETIRTRNPLHVILSAKYERDDLVEKYSRLFSETTSVSTSLDQSTDPESTTVPSQTHLKPYPPSTPGSRLVDAYFTLMQPRQPRTPQLPVGPHSTPTHYNRRIPTTISVYRLKSLVAAYFGLTPLKFKLIYESDEFDPVEVIDKGMGGIAGDGGAAAAPSTTDSKEQLSQEEIQISEWRRWGEWDVDDLVTGDKHGQTRSLGTEDTHGNEESEDQTESGRSNGGGVYITRAGQRFKKRETEILDGMRPWGDFLDEVVAGHLVLSSPSQAPPSTSAVDLLRGGGASTMHGLRKDTGTGSVTLRSVREVRIRVEPL